jgi:peptidoglycan L-alanyl-D-glutamate endopeptidase CwlK
MPLCDPRDLLAGVHPDLARIISRAEMAPQAFLVIQGLRSEASEEAACASGHSMTMHSRHLAEADGKSRAVDLVAISNGEIDWAEGREEAVFGQIAAQIKASAALQAVPLQWGGDKVGAWEPGVPNHFFDWGHFQLPWAEYP